MPTKICIIEDNENVRENLAEILELSGYEVHQAEHGRHGANLVMEVLPDLIICDVMMPEMDGYGVLKILSSNPKTAQIPFIFLTAKADKFDFRKGMSLGADDYITKPFDDLDLLEAIEVRLKKNKNAIQSIQANEHEQSSKLIDEKAAYVFLKSLAENKESRLFKKKDIIYSAGQTPRYLFFIESGTAKSFQTNSLGKELTTKVYQTGDFFGYGAILHNESYHESTAALEPCTLRLIPVKEFQNALLENKNLPALFLKIQANELVDSNQNLVEMAYSSVRKKVANALCALAIHEDNSKPIVILREDLASIAGVAKETTIRTLTDFKDEGIIDIVDNGIVIKDLKKLKNMPQ